MHTQDTAPQSWTDLMAVARTAGEQYVAGYRRDVWDVRKESLAADHECARMVNSAGMSHLATRLETALRERAELQARLDRLAAAAVNAAADLGDLLDADADDRLGWGELQEDGSDIVDRLRTAAAASRTAKAGA